jgi:CubicO group peptidase (beta-lactamase class C family)
LVEVLSGKSFDVFLQEWSFDPLGMSDTAFSVTDDKISRFTANYSPTEDGGFELQDDPETSTYRKHPTFFSGGAGLVSTASDCHRFGQMLLNKGPLDGNRILSRKTVELMTSNHLSGGRSISESVVPGAVAGSDMHGYGFGLGFGVLQDVGTAQIAGSPDQFYWGGGASTLFWVDPVEEVIVVFMTQLMPSSTYPIKRELQVLVNAAIEY